MMMHPPSPRGGGAYEKIRCVKGGGAYCTCEGGEAPLLMRAAASSRLYLYVSTDVDHRQISVTPQCGSTFGRDGSLLPSTVTLRTARYLGPPVDPLAVLRDEHERVRAVVRRERVAEEPLERLGAQAATNNTLVHTTRPLPPTGGV